MEVKIRNAVTPTGQKVAILPITGRFDAKAASETRQLLQQVVGFGYPNLLLNMSKVTFMDSSGLGVLVSAMRKCRTAGGTLCLCEVPIDVQMVLSLTSMTNVFQCFDSEEVGITHFPGQKPL